MVDMQRAASEDEFFHKHSKDLIRKRRKELDEKRTEEEKRCKKNTHWMKCPKCGHDMEETNLEGIMIDRCTEPDCGGMYFDKGELELLMEVYGAKGGFLGKLLGVFK
jgi:uncharacterized protein